RRGNAIREDVHMHLVAYVVGVGMDATSPTGVYSNPRRRGRSSSAGLRCCVSSWTRTSDNAIPIRLKCGPNYQNGRLALLQARADGYDAPILLNQQGHVAEGTGATVFMVRKGRLVTPPVTADILESITRATLIEEICPTALGLDVVEREIDRTELYVAEEAFFCGSGYEITPIVSIDRFPLGDGRVGVKTRALASAYMDLVRGADRSHPEWRTAVSGRAGVRSHCANLTRAIGFRLAGWWGAAWALVAVVLPGAVILLLLAALYFASGLAPAGGRLLQGMSAAVIGLVALTTARLARAALRARPGLLVAAVTFLAVGPLRMSTVLVIAIMAVVSGWLHRPSRLDEGIAGVEGRSA